MSLRNAILFLGIVCLVLPACGGGGEYDSYVEPLNTHEKQLAGSYLLNDFWILEAGVAPYEPSNTEAWNGRLVLNEDRTGTVALEVCEHAGTPTAACDRAFFWSADAGLLRLDCVDEPDLQALLEWAEAGMGEITTESVLPTNDDACGLLLVDDGTELLQWARTAE